MSKRLEQFIRENREAFDSEEPRPQLWKELQNQLNSQRKDERVFHLNFLRWTAAAAIVIMLGGMFYFMQQKKTEVAKISTPAINNNGTEDKVINDIDPNYAKQVYHFTQLIELKQSELKQIEKDHPALYKQFIGDINKLDSSYQTLKIELPKNPNRELLLQAMIQNLKLQTELLNHQLDIIEQLKQKNSDHENNSKSI